MIITMTCTCEGYEPYTAQAKVRPEGEIMLATADDAEKQRLLETVYIRFAERAVNSGKMPKDRSFEVTMNLLGENVTFTMYAEPESEPGATPA